MIRFVDMRDAEIAGICFAWWDTVTSRFLEGEEQAWETWEECKEDLAESCPGMDIGRLEGLLPQWAKKRVSEAAEKRDVHRDEVVTRRSESQWVWQGFGESYPKREGGKVDEMGQAYPEKIRIRTKGAEVVGEDTVAGWVVGSWKSREAARLILQRLYPHSEIEEI